MQPRHRIGRWIGGLAVLLLAAGVAFPGPAHAQQTPVTPNDIRKQLNQPANPAPAPAAAQKTTVAAPKPAATATSTVAQQPTATPASAKPVAHPVARRDPFQPLINQDKGGPLTAEKLPPGKAGLVIATVRVDGVAKGPNGMIAIVANPQDRVYFLRVGDRMYDGRVERVDMSGVLFHEIGQDAFGKPVEREVTKRLYPIPGEQP